MFDWDFTKLPTSEYNRVIKLYHARRWKTLMDIHNKYKLSKIRHCCCESCMENHYGSAIKNKTIYKIGS